MEIPGRYYYIALGFLSYIENEAKHSLKIEAETTSLDNFKHLSIKNLDIATPEHVKLLEDLIKSIKDEHL